MISIQITATGAAAGLQRLSRSIARRKQLHARIAVDVLENVQTYVAGIPDHKTANRLGATPTNHLEKVTNQIEAASNETSATIKVPKASRLRAAFGDYLVKPKKPNGFLTIPVAAESYGRRARTFTDLVALRVGPKKTLILARPKVGVKGKDSLTVLYVLVKQAQIKQDPRLLNFDDMRDTALQSAGDFISELTSEAANKGGKPS
jgi:hypothetical protein